MSRSFYLTLRVLPAPIREPIGLAYLLARATDTIADTSLIPVSERRSALRELRIAIGSVAGGNRQPAPEFSNLAEAQTTQSGHGSPAERALLENIDSVLTAVGSLPQPDRLCIHELLGVITKGQEADLLRFGGAGAGRIEALGTEEELEEYTYCVAGCVGEFWTRMCRTHIFPHADLDETLLLSNGIRFGKGLQLVNILRDLPADLRKGRCYIPLKRLGEHGLAPAALLDAQAMARFRPLYADYLEKARDLLAAGWAYTNALPRSEVRIRLACAWPILIGMRTLDMLRAGNVLDDAHRIKIRRSEVHALILRSLISYPTSGAWNRQFDRACPLGRGQEFRVRY